MPKLAMHDANGSDTVRQVESEQAGVVLRPVPQMEMNVHVDEARNEILAGPVDHARLV